MPGYPPLPNCVIGPEADRVRQADSRRRGGQLDAAVCLLEEALQSCLTFNAFYYSDDGAPDCQYAGQCRVFCT